MESMGEEPRRRRSFTPEFKAEIVELCQRGDRTVGQVARDFDLTETAVRERVRQAERDAGRGQDGGLSTAWAVLAVAGIVAYVSYWHAYVLVRAARTCHDRRPGLCQFDGGAVRSLRSFRTRLPALTWASMRPARIR